LFTQIHEIVYYGKGGYDWVTVYNMPIWLRNFTFKKIQEALSEKSKKEESWDNSAVKEAGLKQKKTISPPSYVSKASKK
tara:strand:- start:38 stop:274 length:237 start_codon:yes stop_codon:yes gene_type:complete